MTDILAAIDAAVGCQHCGGALGDSPSDDFCRPECQEAWHAARVDPLAGYREPWDRPDEFPGVGTEVHSTSPEDPRWRFLEVRSQVLHLPGCDRPDRTEVGELRNPRCEFREYRPPARGAAPTFVVFDEAHVAAAGARLSEIGRQWHAGWPEPAPPEPPAPDPRERALHLRQNRNTGPPPPRMDGRRR